MALYTVSSGSVINAQDVNQLVTVLQQNAGGQETGYYYLNGWGNAASDNFGYGVNTRSQGTVPVSVSLNTSIDAPTNCASPGTNRVTASGFHVFTSTTGTTTNAFCGGVYTVQY